VIAGATGCAGAWVTGGPISAICVAGGFGAISLYAGRPAGRQRFAWRLKDIPVFKNMFVAVGLVGLSLSIGLGREVASDPLALIAQPHGPAIVFLLLAVHADAMLCDLPDEQTDRAFGTRTLPVLLGTRVSATLAVVISLSGGASLLLLSEAPAPSVAWLWATALSVTAIAAAIARPQTTKAIVDARPPCIAVIGAVLLA